MHRITFEFLFWTIIYKNYNKLVRNYNNAMCMYSWKIILPTEYESQQILLTKEVNNHSNSSSLKIKVIYQSLDGNLIVV